MQQAEINRVILLVKEVASLVDPIPSFNQE